MATPPGDPTKASFTAPGSMLPAASSIPLFGSPDDHLLWNGLSFLNQELANLFPRLPGDNLAHATQSAKKRNNRGTCEWQQDVLCNLLVRRHEVIAAILAGLVAQPAVPNHPGNFTAVVQPRILIATNPQSDGFDMNQKAGNMRVAAFRPSRLDTTQGVICAVLRKYREAHGDVSFSTHVGWFSGLLSDCHSERLDDAAYGLASNAFAEYVYLASHPAMLARLKIGMRDGQGNFFEVMTARIDLFPAGSFNSTIPESFTSVLPSDKQASFASFIFNRVAANDGGAWVTAGTTAEARCQAPLYDLEGRKFFHGMLSVLLEATSADLHALSEALQDSGEGKWEQPITAILIAKVTNKVARAKESVLTLNFFLVLFAKKPFGSHRSGLLSHHLSWLSDCANVKNRTDMPFTASTTQGSPESIPKPSSKNFTAATHAGPDAADVAGPIAEAIAEDETADSMNSEGDDTINEVLQLEQLTLSDGKADQNPGTNEWAAAGHKYLSLISLHERSRCQACPAKKARRNETKSKHIRNADVTVMDTQFAEYPSERLPVEKCLDLIFDMEGSEDLNRDELVDRITSKLRITRRAGEERSCFKGTMHCATVIMSIILLTKLPDIPATTTIGEWLEHNGICGLESIILALVKDPRSLRDVSKGCCPPYQNMVKVMLQDGVSGSGKKLGVAYPVHHTKWSATALPLFLLKEYVDKCLRFAKQEALEQLKELQKRINEEKASSEHSSSQGSNTGTADQDEDDLDPPDGYEDPHNEAL